MARDDFGNTKSRIIAEQAAYLCSNPECRMITSGPHTNENKSLKNSVAAHICAASPGEPRYDPNQTSEERSGAPNGIWLCHNHSDLIDKDTDKYTKDLLLECKIVHFSFIENERKHNYSTSSNRYKKEAAEYQYKMYEGYRDEAKYMLATYDAGGWTGEINDKFTEARERRQKNENLYFEFFDEASQIRDWRKFFGSVPVPEECTAENTTIPATESSVNWGKTPTPTPTLVNPDLVF